MRSGLRIAGVIVGLSSFALSPAIGEPGSGEDRPRRHRPPAEAIEACAGADEGNACSFLGRRGEDLTGICELRGGGLVCRPDGPPPRHRRHRESFDG